MAVNFTPGIDVSNNNGTIDWSTVARCGPQFAVMKATEGTYFVDSFFPSNWQQSAAHGLVRGAYAFARPSSDTGAQDAQFFLENVLPQGLNMGDFLVLDLEDTLVPSTSDLLAYALNWLQTVQSVVGFRPMIYTGHWYSQSHDLEGSTALEEYGLWMADYTLAIPRPIYNWPFWSMWQYTSLGVMPGINHAVDLDLFNGSLEQLRLYGKP